MEFVNILTAGIIWFCSVIFGMIALWSFKRKDPMHFWSGSTVKPEEITDIPAYNRANGYMWTAYAVCMLASGVLALFHAIIGAVALGIISIPGVIVLIIVYNRIYRKYRNTPK